MKDLRSSDTGLLILRIGIGIIFVLHGWMKLFGGQISFVQEMLNIAGVNLPAILIQAAAVLELVCGGLLLAGLWSRAAAGLLSLEMLLVLFLFHLREGFFIVAVPNIPLAYGFEFHVALIAGLACIACSGPGAWTLEARFFRLIQSTRSSA